MNRKHLIWLLFANYAIANTDKTDFSFEAATGLQHDSSLRIAELDDTENQSDIAWLFQLAGKLSIKPTERLSTQIQYQFRQRDYQQAENFNTQIHQAAVDLKYRLDLATIGVSHYYNHVILDREALLDLSLTQVYAAKMVTDHTYLRGAYQKTSKQFDAFTERDASGDTLMLDSYWFFNNHQSHLSAGLSFGDETARDPQFNFDDKSLRVGWQHQTSLLSFPATVWANIQYRQRQYQRMSEQHADVRQERSTDAALGLRWEWNDTFGSEIRLENKSTHANIAEFDVQQFRSQLLLKAKF